MSIKRLAISGMLWTTVQQFGRQGVSFIVMIILARILTPSEFGLIGMLTIFIGVSTIMVESGMSNSLIRSDNMNNDDYSTVFYFNLAISIFLYLVLFFTAPLIANFYKQSQLILLTRLYCLTFVINALSTVQIARLNKLLIFNVETISTVISSIISGALSIFLALKGYGVISLVWMYLSYSICNTLIIWSLSRWKPSLNFNITKLKYHFDFGYKITLSSLVDTIFTNSYNVIIGKIYSPQMLGYYNRADNLKQFPVSNLSAIINKVTFPLLASLNTEPDRQREIYKQIIVTMMFFVTPILSILIVLGEPFIVTLLSEKWLPSVTIFQVLCLTGILYPLHLYNLNILSLKGRSDLVLKLEFVKKAILVFTIFFSYQHGVIGLAIGQVIYSFVAYFVNSFYSDKLINYSFIRQIKDIAPVLLITAITVSIVFTIDIFLIQNSYLFRLLVGSIAGLVVYLVINYMFNRIFFTTLLSFLKKEKK